MVSSSETRMVCISLKPFNASGGTLALCVKAVRGAEICAKFFTWFRKKLQSQEIAVLCAHCWAGPHLGWLSTCLFPEWYLFQWAWITDNLRFCCWKCIYPASLWYHSAPIVQKAVPESALACHMCPNALTSHWCIELCLQVLSQKLSSFSGSWPDIQVAPSARLPIETVLVWTL